MIKVSGVLQFNGKIDVCVVSQRSSWLYPVQQLDVALFVRWDQVLIVEMIIEKIIFEKILYYSVSDKYLSCNTKVWREVLLLTTAVILQ